MAKAAKTAWVASCEARAAAYLAKAREEESNSQLNELLNQLSDIRQECRARMEEDDQSADSGQVSELGEKVWKMMCEVADKMDERVDTEESLIRAGLLTRAGPHRPVRQHRGFRETVRDAWRKYVKRA